MLSLTRKHREEIVLIINGVEAVISIDGLNHGRVVLGFDFPDSVPIYRRELWERLKAERGQIQTGPGNVADLGRKG